MFLNGKTRRRNAARTTIVGGILIGVIAALGAVAWGLGNITKAKRVDSVATYYVNAAAPGAGEQHVQLLNVGGAVVTAYCQANYMDPATNPGYPYGVGMGAGIFVTNDTSHRILVTTQPWGDDTINWNDYIWLAPGQSDPVFGVRQTVNEDNATDLGWGAVATFAILSHSGLSATGTLAWSAAVNPGNPTVAGTRSVSACSASKLGTNRSGPRRGAEPTTSTHAPGRRGGLAKGAGDHALAQLAPGLQRGDPSRRWARMLRHPPR